MKVKLESKNGITLIALVITIVILIILAGVTINVLLGDNGIIKKARQAVEADKSGKIEVEVKLALSVYSTEKAENEDADLKQILERELDKNELSNVIANDKFVIIDYKDHEFKFDIETGEKIENTRFDIWDDTKISLGLVGEGTKEKPYLIRSAADLNYMKTKVVEQGSSTYAPKAPITGLEDDGVTPNNCNLMPNGCCYKLMTNIALNDISEYDKWNEENFDESKLNKWKPINICTDYEDFSFDGNGYEITGMYIGEDEITSLYIGFFGYVSSGRNFEIKNVMLTNIYIKNRLAMGGLVGYLSNYLYGRDDKVDETRITNCYVTGLMIQESSSETGGIVGWANSTQGIIISGCTNGVNIIANRCVGGIAGIPVNSTIIKCENYGNISGRQYCGGIAGEIRENSNGNSNIDNCKNYGEIKFDEKDGENYYYYLGGIAGGVSGNIKNCSNYGKIHEHKIKDDKQFCEVGGVVGAQFTGEMENVYNYSDINILNSDDASSQYIGGILGVYNLKSENVKIINANNYGNVTGNKNDVGGILGSIWTTEGDNSTLTLVKCNNYGTIFNGKNYVGIDNTRIIVQN